MDRFRKPADAFLNICKLNYEEESDQLWKLETLKKMLNKDQSLLFAEDKDCKSAIHLAAERGNYHILKYLIEYEISDNEDKDQIDSCTTTSSSRYSLSDSEHVVPFQSKIDANKCDKDGRTALHLASMQLCKQSELHTYVECIQLLMAYTNINRPDNDGYTAATYAVTQRHKDRLLAMLNSPKSKYINFDISTADGAHSARTAITRYYPEMSEDLNKAPAFNEENGNYKLLATLVKGDFQMFKTILSSAENKNPDYDEPYYASLIEVACSLENRSEFVKALIHNGADPDTKNHITKKPLLHLAVENAKKETLEVLLKKAKIGAKDRVGCTVLHHAAKQQVMGIKNISRLQSCIGMLLRFPPPEEEIQSKKTVFSTLVRRVIGNRNTDEVLVTDKYLEINCTDTQGNTPLHLAARFGHEETILTLLKNEANLLSKNNKEEYALTEIDVDILHNFLDEKIGSANTTMEDKDFFVEFNYDFLCKNKDQKDILDSTGMKALYLISRREQMQELLKHPILQSFLHFRWEKFRHFFYINVVFSVVFVLLLSSYVLVVYDETRSLPNGYENFVSTNAQTFSVILIISLCVLTLRELGQLFSKPITYLKNFENYLEITLITCSVIILFFDGGEVDPLWRKYLSPLINLLAWSELVLITGRTPLLSPQLEMLKKVTLTFLQYMPWYLLVLLAFNFSFYSLFRDVRVLDERNLFESPLTGLFKTVLMMTGEYNMPAELYEDVPVVSHLIFLAFVFLVAIVMLNLLSGLAVGDTSHIRQKADILSLVYRVNIVVHMEQFANAIYFDKLFKMEPDPCKQIFPKKQKRKRIFFLLPYGIHINIIYSAMDILARKKKSARNKTGWGKYFRRAGDISKLDDTITNKLELFDKRLKSIETMLTHLITLNGGIPRVHLKDAKS